MTEQQDVEVDGMKTNGNNNNDNNNDNNNNCNSNHTNVPPSTMNVDNNDKYTTTTTTTTSETTSVGDTTAVTPNHRHSNGTSNNNNDDNNNMRATLSPKTSWSLPKIDNPMPHLLPEGENATPLEVIGKTTSGAASDKLVLIMVGLPATGKTHIAKRICRFLSFFHDIPSQIFNVGDYRRRLFGAQQPASFYSNDNPNGAAARNQACDAALADLIKYIQQPKQSLNDDNDDNVKYNNNDNDNPIKLDNKQQQQQQDLADQNDATTTSTTTTTTGAEVCSSISLMAANLIHRKERGGKTCVAAFDATNSTVARRRHILESLKQSGIKCKTMFIESICNEEEVSCCLFLCLCVLCFVLLVYVYIFDFCCCSFWFVGNNKQQRRRRRRHVSKGITPVPTWLRKWHYLRASFLFWF